jgi:hypothetical protein
LQSVGNPKAQYADIARAGDVDEVRFKAAHLLGHPLLVPAQKGIAGEIVIQRKRRRTAFHFYRREGLPAVGRCSGAAAHTKKREFATACECGELPAERRNAIGLSEAIGEKSNAQWRTQ